MSDSLVRFYNRQTIPKIVHRHLLHRMGPCLWGWRAGCCPLKERPCPDLVCSWSHHQPTPVFLRTKQRTAASFARLSWTDLAERGKQKRQMLPAGPVLLQAKQGTLMAAAPFAHLSRRLGLKGQAVLLRPSWGSPAKEAATHQPTTFCSKQGHKGPHAL